MIINVTKEKEDVVLSLEINEKKESFSYVRLVNELYNKKNIEKIVYSDEINEWEKKEIDKLVEQIKTSIKETNEE